MSNATDWISAISTAALGAAGLFLTGWQWLASGFRPRIVSRIDANREAIEVMISNRGRASGILGRVAVVANRGSDLVVCDAVYNGFSNGQFSAMVVPGIATVRLVIEAPDSSPFPADAGLMIDIGEGRDRHIVPRHDQEIGLFGLRSILPPSQK